ncbi:MAG: homocysteine S-methyltransferase family protein [Candidatus Faecousia sp.]|nr:homocysteine S-methyltransferase family protein [Clostridiales bacterium]MDY6180994.1 homocysteine S-methyltransferase family protein [Candidatus Faecousia sp.]
MLSTAEFQQMIQEGLCLLDGATGSNLRLAGMPKGVSTELWVLENPEPLVSLQRAYAQAGSRIIYAPTFQAQPIALKAHGMDHHTERINASLAALSRSAAPDCLIAGDLTTLAAYCDSWDPENFDLLVENYRRQIRGLLDGGVDLLVGETLLYPQEAEAIFTAAELEGAGASMYTFTMQADGSLFSGAPVGPILRELEKAGAAAVGFNCVAADEMTPALVSIIRRELKGPLICKPNAGNPVINSQGIAEYPMEVEEFSRILLQCRENGAQLLGGCCGTTPDFLAAIHRALNA